MKHSMPFYGMGFLGAAVYYIQHASSFWMGLLGIVKPFSGPRCWSIRRWNCCTDSNGRD
ncbi:MAG: hypothetical protein ABII64_04830 [Elusimicrobiota bacterium]